MSSRSSSALARLGTVAAVAAVVVLGGAAPAAAHVLITSSTTAAGAAAALAVTVPHGCDGSATTAITIGLPAGVSSVEPVASAEWAVDTGDAAPDQAGTVTYTAASPLPDGEQAVLEMRLRLPDTEGVTLAFPTVQACEQGEDAWIEVPAEGQSADDLAMPAPALIVTAAQPGESAAGPDRPAPATPAPHSAGPVTAAPGPVPTATPGTARTPAGGDDGAAAAEDAATAEAAEDEGGPGALVAVTGTAVLGALIGGGALLARRRRT